MPTLQEHVRRQTQGAYYFLRDHALSSVATLHQGMSNNVERQTRSHFGDDITYRKHAFVRPLFLKFNTMPVTLATLWAFKKTLRGWSGQRLAAFVFVQLYMYSGDDGVLQYWKRKWRSTTIH
ncbi:hypothetical protein EMPS_07275 [Entomortierella parvispora]|uniref:Uncharacterized protein n=1 Tax=Entomortierella parvispora TaxID=205924 RepID=A0A9P3LY98_9FUNG|nr:hypothetical protein EMPS_07275 [Entomortierella parvispora]